jgi:hypothetical protein
VFLVSEVGGHLAFLRPLHQALRQLFDPPRFPEDFLRILPADEIIEERIELFLFGHDTPSVEVVIHLGRLYT